MVILLKRKSDINDKQALIVSVENGETYFNKRLAVGDTLEVDEQLGYKIMAQYPNCFEQFHGEKYATKVMKAESK